MAPLVGLTVGLSSCAVAVPGTGTPVTGSVPQDRPSSSTPAPPSAAPPGDAAEDTPDATSVGAPFDPCTTVGWADFPETVRATNPNNLPTLMTIAPDHVFSTGCRYNNSEASTITLCGPDSPPGCSDIPPDMGAIFLINVVWGERLPTNPANSGPGARAVDIGGRPGLVNGGGRSRGESRCVVAVPLARGAAGVAVTDARFGVDTCEVALGIAEIIAERVG